MSLRYTNTEKWNDAWFANLKPLEKLIFIYLCDNCDIAGFIEVNLKRWITDIGTDKRGIEGALKGLNRGIEGASMGLDRAIVVSESGDCYFIKNFLKHQKNLPINPSNPAHKAIISRFNNYSDKFNFSDYNEFIEAPTKGHRSPLCNGNGNGKGKLEKGGVGEKTKKIPTMEETVEYFGENGYSKEAAEKFWKYYDSGKWKDSKGKPVLSWKQKAQSVWFTPENRKGTEKSTSMNRKLTREEVFGNG